MKLAYLPLLLPLLGFSCAPASKPHIEPGRYEKTIKVDGIERSYILRVPKQYDNKTSLPVVFVYHGWTSTAKQAEAYTQFGAKSEKEGFILVVPDGTEGINKLRGWNCGFLNLGNPDADDVKMTSDILDSLERDMYVDEKRVYVAGHSNGAMMAYDLGAKLSDRIAAIAVVSGSIGTARNHIDKPTAPVSAIILHGTADPTVPYDSNTKALIQTTSAPDSAKWWAEQDGCAPVKRTEEQDGRIKIDLYPGGKSGAEVELISIKDGGHMWPNTLGLRGPGSAADFPATDRIWDFFKSHPKK